MLYRENVTYCRAQRKLYIVRDGKIVHRESYILSGMGKSCTEKVIYCQGWENRAQRKLYIVRDGKIVHRESYILSGMGKSCTEKVIYCQGWENRALRKLHIVRDGKIMHRESYILSGMGKSCTEKVIYCQGWENHAQRKLYIVRDGKSCTEKEKVTYCQRKLDIVRENRAQRKLYIVRVGKIMLIYCQGWENRAQRKLYIVRDGKIVQRESYVLSGMVTHFPFVGETMRLELGRAGLPLSHRDVCFGCHDFDFCGRS